MFFKNSLQQISSLLYWIIQPLHSYIDKPMLTDLKTVEDSLFTQASIAEFYTLHDVFEVIAFLNKAKKQETKDRIKYLFSKTSQTSPEYKMLLHAPLTQKNADKKEVLTYLASQNSEEYFRMLVNRESELLPIIRQHPDILPILFQLVSFQYGIKMIKLFKSLYERHYQEYEKQLLTEDVKEELAKGIGLVDKDSKQFLTDVDTVVQMRFAEIIINVAVIGGKCFEFVEDLLSKLLHLYKTEDLLLKINLVEVISTLGQGVETSNLLKDHPIWKYIQKDASDKDQDFYIRKYLLIILAEMWNQRKYDVSFKIQKQFEEFLQVNLQAKGEYMEAAIDLITSLFKQYQGVKIVVKSSDVFSKYIVTSRGTQNSIKKPYLDSLISLTEIAEGSNPVQKKRSCINILNCIGNVSLCTGLSQNIDSDTIMVEGLQQFAEWFANYLLLPFTELQLKLVNIFINLLEYREVMEYIFQNQNSTKYLLRPINDTNSDKVLRERKNLLLNKIIHKGAGDWKGHELEEYCRMLEKELKHTKVDVQYALDTE